MELEADKIYKQNMNRLTGKIITLIFIFCVIFSSPVFSVGSDSLEVMLQHARGKKRIDLLIVLTQREIQSHPEKALDHALEAVQLSKNMNNDHLKSDAYKVLGDVYYELDSLKSSLFAYTSGVEAEESSQEPRLDSLSHRYSDLAYVFCALGMSDKASIFDTKALEINKVLNDSVEMAINYLNIGVNLKLLGRYGEAIQSFNEALKIDKKLGKEADIAIDYNNIGMVYQAWGKFQDAIHFFRMAYDIDYRLGNKQKVAIRLSNIAKVYMDMNQIPKAIENYEKALEIDRALNVTQKIPVRLQGLGNAYLELKQYSKALIYFNEALGIYKSLDQEHRIANLLNNIGKTYFYWGQLSNAGDSYLRSLNLAQKLNLNPEKSEAAFGLYLISKAEKNYENALKYFETYNAANDSIFSEESSRQVEEFRIRYETETKEAENHLLTKENELRKKTQRFSTIIIFALLLATVTLFYSFRIKSKLLKQNKLLLSKEQELLALERNKSELERQNLEDKIFAEKQITRIQREKFESELEFKNRELANATLALISKNDVLLEIKSKLSAKASGEFIPDVIRFINLNFDEDQNWNKFKMEFDAIHPGFFSRIKENYPDFSENFQRLCAYLRIGLTSKEIAQLMNVSMDAINKNRQRLRKRLNLEAESDLTEYLKRI